MIARTQTRAGVIAALVGLTIGNGSCVKGPSREVRAALAEGAIVVSARPRTSTRKDGVLRADEPVHPRPKTPAAPARALVPRSKSDARGALAHRPTCTGPYLRQIAKAHLGTRLYRNALKVGRAFLRARGVHPDCPAARIILPAIVAASLYDSGEARYAAPATIYGSGTHYNTHLRSHGILGRGTARAVRDALSCSHHAFHFKEALEAARRAHLPIVPP